MDRPRLRPPLRLVVAAVCTVLCVFSNPTAPAAQRAGLDEVLENLEGVRGFRDTAIDSEGRRIAWVEQLTPSGSSSAIYTRDLSSVVERRVSAAATGQLAREHDPSWSPDGSLVFLSDAGSPGQEQLYLVNAAGNEPTRLTSLAGQLATPRFSPDGRQIAFLLVSGSTQPTGALVAYTPDSGVVGESIDEQRIAVLDIASRSVREVSPANLFVYDYDWSPDGQAFAAEAVEGSGTNNYWTAQLYVVDADTGRTQSLWKPPLQIAVPRWSPDGALIAVVHGIMSDEGANGGDIFVVPSAGGAARNVTPGLEGSARSLSWQRNGDLIANEYVDGQSAMLRVNPSTGRRTVLWSAPQQVSALAVAGRGNGAIAIVQSFDAAPEIYAGPLGSWTRITAVNASVQPMWGEARSLHWTSDSFDVQGWLLLPRNLDPTRKYPMVVSVHGGPSSANVPGWPARWNAVLPTQGYAVLLPNPRGSFGSGERFAQANVKDFGYGDLRDILAGVDAAVKAAPIDPDRVGITGWSYGGYMTMWAVTQTTRFRAAVAGAGIANWQSYYGQNRIDQWMLPFFGASVYDDPAVYARSSPITFITRVKTPTLVLHGDRDSEVPTPQGYEFWHALKALGVQTELVIFPNEGHAIGQPEHVRDLERRLVGWFNRFLKGEENRDH